MRGVRAKQRSSAHQYLSLSTNSVGPTLKNSSYTDLSKCIPNYSMTGMKQFFASLFFTYSFICQAGSDLPSMTPEQRATMEKCVGEIDFAKLNEIQQRGMDLSSEIRKLCLSGKRDAAASKGRIFASEIWYSPELTKIRNCASKASEAPLPDYEKDNIHICDGKYSEIR